MDPGSHTFTKFADCAQLNVLRCPNEETFQHHLRALMSVYMGEAGCFLYLLSVVVTRGAQCIREEMDDLETTCNSQNLLFLCMWLFAVSVYCCNHYSQHNNHVYCFN